MPSQKIVWGYEILNVMIKLLIEAKTYSNYSYYHLLSGSDMLLKDPYTIKKEIERISPNNDINFIDVVEVTRSIDIDRVSVFNLYVKYKRDNGIIGIVTKSVNKIFYYFQKLLKINRIKSIKCKLYRGSTWWSITNDFVEYIIDNFSWIKNILENIH